MSVIDSCLFSTNCASRFVPAMLVYLRPRSRIAVRCALLGPMWTRSHSARSRSFLVTSEPSAALTGFPLVSST